MPSTIEKLNKQILQHPNSEVTVNINFFEVILTKFDDAPYYSLCFDNLSIHLDCFWRVITNERVFFSITDDKQIFGQGHPYSITENFSKIFASKRLTKLIIKYPINDLILFCEDGDYIEVFADSSSYESWIISSKLLQIICMGGGKITKI